MKNLRLFVKLTLHNTSNLEKQTKSLLLQRTAWNGKLYDSSLQLHIVFGFPFGFIYLEIRISLINTTPGGI